MFFKQLELIAGCSKRGQQSVPQTLASGGGARPVAAHGVGNDIDDDDFDYDHFPDVNPGAGPRGQRRRSSASDATPLMINTKDLELGAELGAGEFGAVLRGVWTRPDGAKVNVAIKTLRQEAIGKGEREFLGEANVMLRLAHPHVVRLAWLGTLDANNRADPAAGSVFVDTSHARTRACAPRRFVRFVSNT